MVKQVWLVYCNNKNMRKPIKKVIENRISVFKLDNFIKRVEIIEEFNNYIFVEVVMGNDKVYEVFRNLSGAKLMINDGKPQKLTEDEKKKYGFKD